MATNNIYIVLLDRFMRGETSQEEEKQLLAWFRGAVSREELFTFYKQKWEKVQHEDLSAEVQGRMYLQIKARMHEVEEAGKKPDISIHSRRRLLFRWLPYAAAMLICLFVGLSSYLYVRQSAPASSEYLVSAEKGQRAGVTLPDGTKVWLNSHTELRYNSNYGIKERTVTLIGEAFFEVAKDTEHCFIVKAGEMEVEALGTSFNVKAYHEDDNYIVTLITGKIRAIVGNEIAVLTPDQHVSLNRKSNKLTVAETVNSSYACMWRNDELAFEGETLGDIAVLLSRMYNVQVEFRSERIKNYRFSGVIRNNSLDNVIEIISLTAPITYESRGDTIILSENL